MKWSFFSIFLTVGIVVPAWSAMALTDDEVKEMARAPLRGLQGVNVVVEVLDPDMKEAGISEEMIQTKIELRLRTSGIKVFSEQERLEIPGRPYLYLNLNSVFNKNKDGQLICCSYSLDLSLMEKVLLQRDKSKECYAEIWNTSSVGYAGIRRIDSIYDYILNKVDVFCNDYLAANPPVASSGSMSGADFVRELELSNELPEQKQKLQPAKKPQNELEVLPSDAIKKNPSESKASTKPTTQPAPQ
jgi:hypothetical protein